MKTIIYLVRHADKEKDLFANVQPIDTRQISDEKCILSIEGEERAKEFANISELENIQFVYTSNYVRTFSTAKYIAKKKKIKVLIDSRLGKTKEGIESNDRLPDDYFIKQWENLNYKIGNGESINETSVRVNECFNEIINRHKGKNILIVAHGSSIASLFTQIGVVKFKTTIEERKIYFKDELIYEGKIKFTTLFKVELEDNNVVAIKTISF